MTIRKLRAPQVLSFWWDFNQPGELPIRLESNHPALPDTIATFNGPDAIERAVKAVRLIEDADIHPRMKPDRILERILSVIAETRPGGLPMTIRKLREAVEAGEWWGDLPRPAALHTDLAWKAFNGSLDSALALMRAVLPGWYWDCGTESLDGTFFGRVETPHAGAPKPHEIIGHADTPARALLLAVLKSLEAQSLPDATSAHLGNQPEGGSQ